MYIWTAMVLGLFGSLHCLGMCGPLAVALPPAGRSRSAYLLGRLLYNLARIVTYASLGALFGFLGYGFALAGAQRGLSIAIGVGLLLAVLLRPRGWAHAPVLPAFQRAHGRLRKGLSQLLRRHSLAAMVGIGSLNGFLPCGLVYVALAAATATGGAREGFLYMAFFGLGTLPLMLVVSLLGKALQFRLQVNLRRAVPVAIVMLATLFILRGMALGIPYVSPVCGENGQASCCSP